MNQIKEIQEKYRRLTGKSFPRAATNAMKDCVVEEGDYFTISVSTKPGRAAYLVQVFFTYYAGLQKIVKLVHEQYIRIK